MQIYNKIEVKKIDNIWDKILLTVKNGVQKDRKNKKNNGSDKNSGRKDIDQLKFKEKSTDRINSKHKNSENIIDVNNFSDRTIDNDNNINNDIRSSSDGSSNNFYRGSNPPADINESLSFAYGFKLSDTCHGQIDI